MSENMKFEEPVNAGSFVLRNLKATDMFLLMNLINKIGLQDFLKHVDQDVLNAAMFPTPVMMSPDGKTVPIPEGKLTKAQKNALKAKSGAQEKLLMDSISLILANAAKAENEIFALVAPGYGMSPEELKEVDLDVFLDLLYRFFFRDGFKDFFSGALQRLGVGVRSLSQT